jgi:NADH-quinone oxidoreductase subunit L
MEHAVHSTMTTATPLYSARPEDLGWFILALPLIAAFATTVALKRSRVLTLYLSLGAAITAFFLSWTLFFAFGAGGHSAFATPFPWFHAGGLNVDIGLVVDPLSTVMLLVVTGVSALVQIYSTGYMKTDPGFTRFFAGISFFTFSMLGIVLADNLVMMFIFWELVGVSSYLLIGFWNDRPTAADAAKKAFLTNRVGDFGFILGIILVWSFTGTVSFSELSHKLSVNSGLFGNLGSIVGLLIFCGAMGKSAQFPLHVWLPDAMEGPTPVSALIHAATMVAAGVYMLCRTYFVYQVPAVWPDCLAVLNGISALNIISWIGAFTALLAAVIALQQNDIKRILAYSTLSQLGYMILAVGVGGPDAAMYHLTTHAGFKALLFLGAGAVIHACHHEQDIWKMGGLREKLPITFRTFVLGTAALAGFPLLSGFYSKDAILVAAVRHGHPVLFGLGVLIAVLTTFYMLRLVLVTFFGPARSHSAMEAHEAPASMTWVLMLLALPSVALAWLPLGSHLTEFFFGAAAAGEEGGLLGPFNHAPLAATFGSGAVLFGAWAAFTLYWGAEKDPIPALLGRWNRVLRGRFYFDEIYEAVIIPIHDGISGLMNWVDRWVLSGFVVRGAHGSTEFAGRALRLVQTGNLQTYTFLFVVGVALVVLLALR